VFGLGLQTEKYLRGEFRLDRWSQESEQVSGILQICKFVIFLDKDSDPVSKILEPERSRRQWRSQPKIWGEGKHVLL